MNTCWVPSVPMTAILIAALLLGNFASASQCTDNVRLRVVRQEKFKGCGSDDIGADMHVIYRFTNDSDHPIYIFGFTYERDFMPHGYVLRFNDQTRQWLYPTSDDRPVRWSDVSADFKSPKKLEPKQSLDFEACHSSWAERGKQFARTVYVSCDVNSIPTEFVSDGYTVALK